jgi:dTDP-4-amino-4,6-dideoxygalactose transaminase
MIKGFSPQAPLLFSPRKLWALWKSSSSDDLELWTSRFFGKKTSFFLSSGRAGLYLILEALKGLSAGAKDGVIIPAYTCPTVPHTIKKAGLRVLLCEIEKEGFSFQVDHLERLLDKDVLAVVPTHLFGFPCDMEKIGSTLLGRDIFTIEDFSHSIGSLFQEKRLGTLSDVSFSSLGRGKLLTTSEGGLVLSNSEDISQELKTLTSTLPQISRLRSYEVLTQLLIFHAVIAKNRWGLILNSTIDPERRGRPLDFDVFSPSSFQLSLLKESLVAMDDFNRKRVERAEYLREGISRVDGIIMPGIPQGAMPVYMMFPVLFEDVSRLESVFNVLRGKKIGVTRMYKSALNKILKNDFGNPKDSFLKTESLAEKLILLPCHPYIPYSILDKVIEVVCSV